MKELCRTNDAVLQSYIEALLKDAKIPYFAADQHMSAMEAYNAIWPRRIFVEVEDWPAAAALLDDAGIERAL
ncbi:MAG: DUF2007 domain-containing protein [Hyphomicrobiales bacterium]|nr:DUF2007 domain-containing protein [Hyphomicrobiales bacterium]